MDDAGFGLTRSGTHVRVFTLDGGGDYPILGAWLDMTENRWIPHAWTNEGRAVNLTVEMSLDIVEIQRMDGG